MSTSNFRNYCINDVAGFNKTTELFGGLSNMASGYPIVIDNVTIFSSEALYQACRYPDWPEAQKIIIGQHSPMTAKMISKKEREKCRAGWDSVRVAIMRWCLRVKLAQNWDTFSDLLESTGNMPIVEISNKDDFWGCKQKGSNLIGVNALGRLLMELRKYSRSAEGESCEGVNPPNINNFKLLGVDIGFVPRKNSTFRQRKLL